ncbi:hypothetical protein BCR39DRAFT_527254 [Naematelia encephala]|uniref:Uncharacterized protein n=1 Tax=Naematelia encephala TaxID=71784 RepID=A0A1Y2B9Z3_9TREE|nr:hypothetical protein BCR39DRAFT_527254 [Naematelia encephala]
MSVLRLLSSVNHSASGSRSSWTAASSLYAHDEVTTSSSTKSDDGLSLTLHVPAYGAVLMNPPDETYLQPTPDQDKPPRNDQVLQGHLGITLPAGGGRRRCKSIQVGFKTVTKLDLGPGRMSEVDTIFERKVDFPTSGEGIWLDEGSQGFEFTLILPATLAPHDWHGNGVVIHHLHAKVEGLPNPAKTVANQSIFSSFGRSKSPAVSRRGSRTTSSSRSRSRIRSRPASPGVDEATSSLAAGTASIVITDKVKSLPQVPPYQGPNDQNSDWLLGSYEVKRSIMLIYNPNPTGGVNELDERTSGQVAGLGVYDLKLSSDVFTICALMRAKLTIAAIPPNVTIFCFRIQLAQTTTIVSPRDTADEAKPVTHTRHFVVLQEGQRPPRGHMHPAGNWPALWKGKDAGGSDDDEFKVDAKGRLPDDDDGRPSTLPFIITPIRVSHALITEVFFAVYGETDSGKKMPIPGPGGLRVLKISRPVMVPSCACIPQVLNLPLCEWTLGF